MESFLLSYFHSISDLFQFFLIFNFIPIFDFQKLDLGSQSVFQKCVCCVLCGVKDSHHPILVGILTGYENENLRAQLPWNTFTSYKIENMSFKLPIRYRWCFFWWHRLKTHSIGLFLGTRFRRWLINECFTIHHRSNTENCCVSPAQWNSAKHV